MGNSSSRRSVTNGFRSTKRALQVSPQLVDCAIDGLVQRRCLVRDGRGMEPLDASHHHTSLIAEAVAVAALLRKVDFNSRDPIAERAQHLFDHIFNARDERFATIYFAICLDVDLHGLPFHQPVVGTRPRPVMARLA